MKKIIVAILAFSSLLPLVSFAQDGTSRASKYGNNPIKILDTVVNEANEDYQIQQTSLDTATSTQ